MRDGAPPCRASASPLRMTGSPSARTTRIARAADVPAPLRWLIGVMRTVTAFTAAVLAAAIAAPAASAGQFVAVQGGNVVAMNDDGSGARTLVTPAQLPGMGEIDGASVQPNATRIAFDAMWSGAHDEMFRWSPPALGACGLNCVGIYRLDGGSARRLTSDATTCGPSACSSADDGPQVASNGEIFNDRDLTTYSYAPNSYCGGWCPDISGDTIVHWDTAGAPQPAPKTLCDDYGTTDPKYVATDPAHPAHLLYSNCHDANDGNYVLIDGGNDSSSTADDTVIDSDPGAIAYPAFSPDGGTIAEMRLGAEPGVWTSAHGAAWVQRIALNAAQDVGEVHFLSGGRLGFVADGDLYSISGTCTAASCSFPAGATKLASGVTDEWGWTVSNATITQLTAPRANAPAASQPARSTTPAGTGTGAVPTSTTASAHLLLAAGIVGRATVRSGIRVRVRLARAATVTVTVARAHQKAVVLHLKEPAGTRVLTIKRLHARRLRRGTYAVTLRVGTQSRRLAVRVR
jgi:hypothetical protein